MREQPKIDPGAALEPTLAIVGRSAAETERLGRLAPASIAALRDAGLFAPGLSDSGASRTLETLILLAGACPSSAWVVGTSAVSKRFASLSIGRRDAPALLDGLAPACGSGHPTGRLAGAEDDLRLTGRWRWISGCEIAEIAILGIAGPDDDPRFPVGAVAVAMDALEIVADWDVLGMRGTGSHTVSADEIPIAQGSWAPFPLTPDFPLYSTVTVAAPVLGAAVAGAQMTRELLGAPGSLSAEAGRRPIADSPANRNLIRRATEVVDAALRDARAVCLEIDGLEAPTAHDADRLRSRLARTVRQALGAFAPLLDAHGASVFRAGHPLQRLWRDANVGARHPLIVGANADEPDAARPR